MRCLYHDAVDGDIAKVVPGLPGWLEAARRFDESGSRSDEVFDIVEGAKMNPDACIYGTVSATNGSYLGI